MGESYSAGGASGAERSLARDLIARLLPSANADLIVTALLAERNSPEGMRPHGVTTSPDSGRDAADDPATRELRRVRRQFALAESARTVQHALNNPLTALLAEAQLLELEPLADEHLRAVGRIVELARRVAKVSHRLDGGAS
jgi:signal transduction histidine kinase